ncbi:MAG: RNA 2',3'-cyclic phosphodiesterase [Deltaproteobacteria bacterium]|nr:RNA 2',3'-cyclic phosphodiesterase [Deltaproteobacteria bacterium]
MSRIRCFVAAALPEAVRNDLAALQERFRSLAPGLRWVAPASIHLTLKFIGEVEPNVFEAIAGALKPPLAPEAQAILVPRGVGAFPSVRRARVLWVGLAGDVAVVAKAALEVEARLEPLGIPREARPFTPHLTVGRARNPGEMPDLRAALEAEGEYEGPSFTVSELVLYESRLSPKGPTYTPRKIISLQ